MEEDGQGAHSPKTDKRARVRWIDPTTAISNQPRRKASWIGLRRSGPRYRTCRDDHADLLLTDAFVTLVLRRSPPPRPTTGQKGTVARAAYPQQQDPKDRPDGPSAPSHQLWSQMPPYRPGTSRARDGQLPREEIELPAHVRPRSWTPHRPHLANAPSLLYRLPVQKRRQTETLRTTPRRSLVCLSLRPFALLCPSHPPQTSPTSGPTLPRPNLATRFLSPLLSLPSPSHPNRLELLRRRPNDRSLRCPRSFRPSKLRPVRPSSTSRRACFEVCWRLPAKGKRGSRSRTKTRRKG